MIDIFLNIRCDISFVMLFRFVYSSVNDLFKSFSYYVVDEFSTVLYSTKKVKIPAHYRGKSTGGGILYFACSLQYKATARGNGEIEGY
jgi:hypothetical protein